MTHDTAVSDEGGSSRAVESDSGSDFCPSNLDETDSKESSEYAISDESSDSGQDDDEQGKLISDGCSKFYAVHVTLKKTRERGMPLCRW